MGQDESAKSQGLRHANIKKLPHSMNDRRIYCTAVTRAIWELDQCSLRAPQCGQDKRDWQKARTLLCSILDRNGFPLAQLGSRRLRK